ncbi:MAG: hypothetical protein ABQ298_05715 [Puniceicoccaceae bacterium]
MCIRSPNGTRASVINSLLLTVLAVLALWICVSTLTGTFAYLYPSLFWDQWDLYRSYLDYQAAESFWTWVFAPHNGHRISFTRLIFLLDLHTTGATHWMPVSIMVLGQSLLAFGICWPAWKYLQSWRAKAAVTFIVCMLLFSATQLENFTWSFQTQFIGVFLFAFLSFQQADRYLLSPSRLAWSGAFSWGFALLASFSMANGVLVWPVLGVAALLQRRWVYGFASLVLFILIVVPYFLPVIQSQSASHVPIGSAAPDFEFFRFWMVYLANPLGKASLSLATNFGALTLVLTLFVGHRMLSRDSEVRRAAQRGSSLLYMAVFVLGSGLMTTLARVDRGLINATSERYTTGALILIACLCVYGSIQWSFLCRKRWMCCLISTWFAMSVLYLGYLMHLQNFYLHHYGIQFRHKQLALNALQNQCIDDSVTPFVYPELRRHLPALRSLTSQEKKGAHQLPDTLKFGEQTVPFSDMQIDAHALLREDFDSAPRKLVIYGSIPASAELGLERLYFTDSSGELLGTGFAVRRLPDHKPFNQFEPQPGSHLFYGHANRSLADATALICVQRGNRFVPLARLNNLQIEQQPMVSLRKFSADGLQVTRILKLHPGSHWTQPGIFPGIPKPEGVNEIWGSWSGSDANTGSMEMEIEVTPGQRQLLLPYLSGPAIPDARIEVRSNSSTAQIFEQFALPLSPERWSLVAINIPPHSKSVILRIEESGSMWGQWIGIAAPYVR